MQGGEGRSGDGGVGATILWRRGALLGALLGMCRSPTYCSAHAGRCFSTRYLPNCEGKGGGKVV